MLRLYVSIEMTFLGEGFKREKNQLALQKVVDFLEQKFWLSRLLPRTVLLDLDTGADDVTTSGPLVASIHERPIFRSLAANLGTTFEAPKNLGALPTMTGLEPAIPRSEVWCLIH